MYAGASAPGGGAGYPCGRFISKAICSSAPLICFRLPWHALAREVSRARTKFGIAIAKQNPNAQVVAVGNAISPEAAETAEMAIYDFLGMDRDDPASWYRSSLGHSIWVPLLRHPALAANRFAPRIHKAHAQLWGRDDLWVTIDQGGFNPPERHDWPFPGPHLHWDATLAEPHHFEPKPLGLIAVTLPVPLAVKSLVKALQSPFFRSVSL